MAPQHKDSRRVKSTDRVFEIVERLSETGEMGVTEIADDLNLAKSTVHGYLSTLEMNEYVVKTDGKYRLGLKFLTHGAQVRREMPLSKIARPTLEKLADETGEVAWLIVEEHGMAVNIDQAKGDNAVQTFGKIGRRTHLHHISGGKAILAHLPSSRVTEIVERHGLPQVTDQTITDQEELRDELRSIRDRGVAFNEGETIEGVRGVGVAIVPENTVLGAVTIGGPANRMMGAKFREQIPDLLLGAANEIELKLTYS